jgi:hypothetical protein
MEPTPAQVAVCDRFGVPPDAPSGDSILGVSLNVRASDAWPLNGLRHRPARGSNGWYIWRGEELRQADDFFEPLHTRHLAQWAPDVLPYLALPSGWRFLLAPGHEDVWYDATLLKV